MVYYVKDWIDAQTGTKGRNLKTIARSAGVSELVIEKMILSTYTDINDITVDDAVKVARQLGMSLEELVTPPERFNLMKKDNYDVNICRNTNCICSNDFIRALNGARYINVYRKTPHFIENFTNLIDYARKEFAIDLRYGVVQDIIIKIKSSTQNSDDESYMASIFVKDDKVALKDTINSKATDNFSKIHKNERPLYQQLKREYENIKGSSYIETRNDVETLISLIHSNIMYYIKLS